MEEAAKPITLLDIHYCSVYELKEKYGLGVMKQSDKENA